MATPFEYDPRLSIKFTSSVGERIEGLDADPSSLIPAFTIGGTVTTINRIALATWDYALSHPNDYRFAEIRELEALNLIQRKDVELVVVSVKPGSLEFLFEWSYVLMAVGAGKFLIEGMIPNAGWDLVKYSFSSIRDLFRKKEQESLEPPDPLIKEILPLVNEMIHKAYNPSANGIPVTTKFTYRDKQHEISFEANHQTAQIVTEANQLETKNVHRIVGSIVAIDYLERTVKVISDEFADEVLWCDIGDLDINHLEEFVTRRNDSKPKDVVLIIEAAWRAGVTNSMPPEAARILSIYPEHERMNPSPPFQQGLLGKPIHSSNYQLSSDELTFLQWFEWADRKWTNPDIKRCINYLVRTKKLLLSRNQVLTLIQGLITQGIILRTGQSSTRNLSSHIIRLNRAHPVLAKHGI